MMHLTPCNLSTLLTLAKEAHTRWEERYRMEGATPPAHAWEDWYAKFIIARLHEQELGETFDTGTCGLETVAENHVVEHPFVSEPSEPDAL